MASQVPGPSDLESAPVLPTATLDRAIALLGNPRAHHALFSALHAGEPIVLGVFGASVAQNAGCIDQAHKRCIWQDGKRNITLPHGWPRTRPFSVCAHLRMPLWVYGCERVP